jgi:lipoprotein-releasing system permease protein
MQLPYEVFIGLRYLRAKRRNRTISFNTLISITGVTIGVAALIATLGIMTGFKEDLQAKILGTNSHILVTTKTGENIKDYETVTDKVATVPGVSAATPFVFKQVLLTTPTGSHYARGHRHGNRAEPQGRSLRRPQPDRARES